MAWAFVQKNYQAQQTAASSYSVTPTAASSTGNTLILFVGSSSGSHVTSVTDSNSNSWTIDVETTTNKTSAICHAYMTSGLSTSSTITINMSGSQVAQVVVAEYSGLSTTPLDQTASASSISTATSVAAGPTGAMSANGELIIAGFMNATAQTPTFPSGFTVRSTSTNQADYLCDSSGSVGNTVSTTWSYTTSGYSSCVIATYEVAGSVVATGSTLGLMGVG